MKKRIIDAKTEALALAMRNGDSLVKLSKTAKLGTFSWSLQALNTCPASIDSKGELVDACKGCYATTGQYNYANVKAPREFNRWAWKQDNFVSDFIVALEGKKFFRWFDSGDMYTLGLAEKILEIMKATPETKHWLPTRMHKFSKFHGVLNAMNDLDNVCVRLSSDSVMGEYVDIPLTLDVETSSTIIPQDTIEGFRDHGAIICSATFQNGKCEECRACYFKSNNVIAYVGHGRVMKATQNKLINTVSI